MSSEFAFIVFGALTFIYVLLVFLLIALIRFFWKKGNNK